MPEWLFWAYGRGEPHEVRLIFQQWVTLSAISGISQILVAAAFVLPRRGRSRPRRANNFRSSFSRRRVGEASRAGRRARASRRRRLERGARASPRAEHPTRGTRRSVEASRRI